MMINQGMTDPNHHHSAKFVDYLTISKSTDLLVGFIQFFLQQRLDPDDPNIKGKNWEAVEKAGKVTQFREENHGIFWGF